MAVASEKGAVLPGFYVLSREEERGGAPVQVRRVAAEDGFEQLRLSVG